MGPQKIQIPDFKKIGARFKGGCTFALHQGSHNCEETCDEVEEEMIGIEASGVPIEASGVQSSISRHSEQIRRFRKTNPREQKKTRKVWMYSYVRPINFFPLSPYAGTFSSPRRHLIL